MKIWLLSPGENWIVDRIVQEWTRDNHDITTNDISVADIIWLCADWCWRQIPYELLKTKKVITTVHHIVESKFGYEAQRDFALRDDITDVYHVPNVLTRDFIRKYTKKRIVVIPYWANQKLWFKSQENKEVLRKKYGLPTNSFLVGSFQRDSEGSSDLANNPQPKLEKGPDLLADAIIKWGQTNNDIHVVLAGWRRQYIVKRLVSVGINYTYFENPQLSVVRDLYQALDLYPVTARVEGGPQSLIECGLLGVPVVSRDVGIATQVLPPEAIHTDVIQAKPSIPNIDGLIVNGFECTDGYRKYRELFNELANG